MSEPWVAEMDKDMTNNINAVDFVHPKVSPPTKLVCLCLLETLVKILKKTKPTMNNVVIQPFPRPQS